MDTRKCKDCGNEFPATTDFFYRHPKGAGGLFNKCKDCQKAAVRKNRAKNIDHYREYDRKRGSRKTASDQSRYRKKYPNAARARRKVAYHVRMGNMSQKSECERCGGGLNVQAHHDDYNKPLDVRWLCAPCHCAWHKKHGPGKNAT